METKTNVMRILDKSKIKYTPHFYSADDGKIDGEAVAEKIGKPCESVFKTLVTRFERDFFVFVVPVNHELDLKKCAKAVGKKSVEMIHVSEINKATGYIRGGCSPIGMKKQLPTYIEETAQLFDRIAVSAGIRGQMLILDPEELREFVGASYGEIVK